MGYAKSLFRFFESYLRIVVVLDEDDIQLIIQQYNGNFLFCELDPGNYTIEDLQEAIHPLGDHGGTLHDDLNKKIKLILTRFESTFGTLRFDEKSFFNTLLGFAPYWEYKLTNAIHAVSPGVYTNDKILNLYTINKIHSKRDVIDESLVNSLRQPKLFNFTIDKPAGYKVFCEPETKHYKGINKSVLNTIKFFSEGDNNEEVNFNQETLTFTLQMIKI